MTPTIFEDDRTCCAGTGPVLTPTPTLSCTDQPSISPVCEDDPTETDPPWETGDHDLAELAQESAEPTTTDTAQEATELATAEDPDHETPPPPVTDPSVTFADLKLNRAVLDAVTHAGYRHPTPIQEAVIPPALRGRDVLGQAQTGTGKTAAFLLPFLTRWRPHRFPGPIGLVMTPTRELALQVAKEAEKLAPCRRFRVVPVYGGTGYSVQLKGLARGCDLVVGTPGRIIDHLQRGSLTLEYVRYVVLDEADRMLDIGFRPDIEKILRRCPQQRQTLLMSATVPDAIKRLVDRYMTDPVHIQIMPEKPTVEKIRQTYLTVDPDKKFELLLRVIEREQPRQCLIFCERKRWADNLYRDLRRKVERVAVIHGDLPQSQRERIMAAFRSGEVRFLIATDVMCRGIDVEGLSHVINYDLPTDVENYVHRIGRTGRIGRDGVAISFVTPDQGELLTNIEKMINRLIDRDEIPGQWYTPRVVETSPSPPPAVLEIPRDPEGWWPDEDESSAPAVHPAAAAGSAPSAEGTDRKPVFGRPRRRYSARL